MSREKGVIGMDVHSKQSDLQHEEHSHAGPPLRTYYLVYGALLVLLVLTVAVAQFHLGAIGVVVALLIALAKAILVLLYFMHLRFSSRLTWVFAGAGFMWLLILFAGVIADYLSRSWIGQ
jgi:cytochrome c oxidase subunit 4